MPTEYRVPLVGGVIASLFTRFRGDAKVEPPGLVAGVDQRRNDERNVAKPAAVDVEQTQQQRQPAATNVEIVKQQPLETKPMLDIEIDPNPQKNPRSPPNCKALGCTKISQSRCEGFCMAHHKKYLISTGQCGNWNCVCGEKVAIFMKRCGKCHRWRHGHAKKNGETTASKPSKQGANGNSNSAARSSYGGSKLSGVKVERSDEVGIKVQRDRSAPQLFVARPSKNGYGVAEGDAAFLAGEPKMKSGLGRSKKAAVPKKKDGNVTKNQKRNRPGKMNIAKASNDGSTSVAPKSIKPLHAVGSAVYAAYWPPHDKSRKSDPSWYFGVVSSFNTRKAIDNRYGPIRSYHVHYDDGDKLDKIPDRFVCSKEDYLLHMRHDGGSNNHSWLGVTNVTDKRSNDLWARNVGWYVVTTDGKKETFPFLSDALRAYDSGVVRKKGLAARESDLNFPEELFGSSDEPGTSGEKALSKKQHKWESHLCKHRDCTEYRQLGCHGYCISHKKLGIPANEVKKAAKRSGTEKSNKRKKIDDSNGKTSCGAPPKKLTKNDTKVTSKQQLRKLCNHEGCTRQARRAGGLCDPHFKSITSKPICSQKPLRNKLCKHPECPKFRQTTCHGYCCSHKEFGLPVNEAKKSTEHLGPDKSIKTKKTIDYGSSSHGVKAHSKRKDPTCKYEGCTSVARRAGGLCELHFKSVHSKPPGPDKSIKRMKIEDCNDASNDTPLSKRPKSGANHTASLNKKEFGRSVKESPGFDKNSGRVEITLNGKNQVFISFSKIAQQVMSTHSSSVCNSAHVPIYCPRVSATGHYTLVLVSGQAPRGEGYQDETVMATTAQDEGHAKQSELLCNYEGCVSLAKHGGICAFHTFHPRVNLCSLPGCIRPRQARGMCALHDQTHQAENYKEKRKVQGKRSWKDTGWKH